MKLLLCLGLIALVFGSYVPVKHEPNRYGMWDEEWTSKEQAIMDNTDDESSDETPNQEEVETETEAPSLHSQCLILTVADTLKEHYHPHNSDAIEALLQHSIQTCPGLNATFEIFEKLFHQEDPTEAPTEPSVTPPSLVSLIQTKLEETPELATSSQCLILHLAETLKDHAHPDNLEAIIPLLQHSFVQCPGLSATFELFEKIMEHQELSFGEALEWIDGGNRWLHHENDDSGSSEATTTPETSDMIPLSSEEERRLKDNLQTREDWEANRNSIINNNTLNDGSHAIDLDNLDTAIEAMESHLDEHEDHEKEPEDYVDPSETKEHV